MSLSSFLGIEIVFQEIAYVHKNNLAVGKTEESEQLK